MYRGWISLHRKITDNPLWTCEPFTRGQAWVDLILLTNHDYSFFYKRGVKIEVKRGQLARSEVELSDRWKWSRSKVRKFLNDLEKEQQIEQHKTNVTQILTIVNYETYQQKEQQTLQQKNSKRTAEEQQKDTYNNVNNDNNENNVNNKKVKFHSEIQTLLNNVINEFDINLIKNLKPKDKEQWFDEIRKLHEIDKYSFDEIEKTIIFGRRDSFWRNNFHTVLTLRKKGIDKTTKFYKINNQLKNHATKKQSKQDDIAEFSAMLLEATKDCPKR